MLPPTPSTAGPSDVQALGLSPVGLARPGPGERRCGLKTAAALLFQPGVTLLYTQRQWIRACLCSCRGCPTNVHSRVSYERR
jgi:hypothetical protein